MLMFDNSESLDDHKHIVLNVGHYYLAQYRVEIQVLRIVILLYSTSIQTVCERFICVKRCVVFAELYHILVKDVVITV